MVSASEKAAQALGTRVVTARVGNARDDVFAAIAEAGPDSSPLVRLRAALGLARRAFDEGRQRATTRRMFGGVLADFQLTQAKLGDMAGRMTAMAGGVGGKGGTPWDKLESIFEERTARALKRLGVPMTACALSGVIMVALWQSRTGGTTVGGFASFITAMLMLLAPRFFLKIWSWQLLQSSQSVCFLWGKIAGGTNAHSALSVSVLS